MNNRIAEPKRMKIIELWMKGFTRDEIATDLGIGAATVTNYIREWEAALGQYDAQAIREFVRETRKNGLSVADCIAGSRIMALLKHFQVVDNDEVERFIRSSVDILTEEISPEQTKNAILDIAAIVKDTGTPIRQAVAKALQMQQELDELEEKTRTATNRCGQSVAEQEAAECQKNEKLKANNVTLATLDQYLEEKCELAKHGLSMEDRSKAIPVIKHIKEQLSGEKIIQRLTSLGPLDAEMNERIKSIEGLKRTENSLDEEIKRKQHRLSDLDREIGSVINLQLGFKECLKGTQELIDDLDGSTTRFNDVLVSTGRELIGAADEIKKTASYTSVDLNEKIKIYEECIEKHKNLENLAPLLDALHGENVGIREYSEALYYALGPASKIFARAKNSLLFSEHLRGALKLELASKGVFAVEKPTPE